MTDGAVVAMGLPRSDFAVAAEPILDLAGFSVERGRALAGALRARLAESASDDAGVFGLLLIDGLCRCEEAVISAIYAGLDDVPVVGGSAGDALRFGVTQIICDGRAYANAAALLLVQPIWGERQASARDELPYAPSLRGVEGDAAIQSVRKPLWIASLRSQ